MHLARGEKMSYTEVAFAASLVAKKAYDMRVKPLWAITASTLVGLLILSLGIWSFAGKKDVAPHKLTILFTGDDLGSNKPCG